MAVVGLTHDIREGDDITYVADDYGQHEDYNETYGGYGEDYPDDYYADHPRDSHNGSKNCLGDLSVSEKEHSMVVIFCDDAFVEIPKCCDKKENLNLR